MENIFGLICISILKLFDNVISSAKTITICKGKKVLSSILVIISQLLFYFVITKVVADNSMLTIWVVSICSGIGNYIGFFILDKFKRDDTWTNVLTCSDKEDMKQLATLLKTNKIKYLLFDTYNRRNENSFSIMAFTKTKQESKLIDNYLRSTKVKYLRMINGIDKTKLK